MSKWDYFEVSPNDQEPMESHTENREDENGRQRNDSFVLGPYSDETNWNTEQPERKKTTQSRNYGMWMVVLFTVIISISIVCYAVQPKNSIGNASSSDSSGLNTSVTGESKARVSPDDDAMKSQKVFLALQLSQIGKEILNLRPYSEMKTECQQVEMSEQEYNQLVHDYQQHDKSYFLQKFEEYTLSKLKSVAGSAAASKLNS